MLGGGFGGVFAAKELAKIGRGTFDVELTKWDLYAVSSSYPYVYATYAWVDGGWTLTDWEYVGADESGPLISI